MQLLKITYLISQLHSVFKTYFMIKNYVKFQIIYVDTSHYFLVARSFSGSVWYSSQPMLQCLSSSFLLIIL